MRPEPSSKRRIDYILPPSNGFSNKFIPPLDQHQDPPTKIGRTNSRSARRSNSGLGSPAWKDIRCLARSKATHWNSQRTCPTHQMTLRGSRSLLPRHFGIHRFGRRRDFEGLKVLPNRQRISKAVPYGGARFVPGNWKRKIGACWWFSVWYGANSTLRVLEWCTVQSSNRQYMLESSSRSTTLACRSVTSRRDAARQSGRGHMSVVAAPRYDCARCDSRYVP
jgi:hypothetical protein